MRLRSQFDKSERRCQNCVKSITSLTLLLCSSIRSSAFERSGENDFHTSEPILFGVTSRRYKLAGALIRTAARTYDTQTQQY